MSIVITGANGFLGRNLYERLFGLFHIEKIYRSTPERELFRILENAKIVFHLAGINNNLSKTHIDFYNSNVRLTQDICDVLKSSQNLAPIIYPSTLDIDNENSAFSLSKKDAEHTLLLYGPSTIFRLPLMLGKYCNNQYSIVSQIFANIMQDRKIVINNSSVTFMFADDLSNLFLSYIEDTKEFSIIEPQPIYTIDSDELTKIIQQIHNGQETDTNNKLIQKLSLLFKYMKDYYG